MLHEYIRKKRKDFCDIYNSEFQQSELNALEATCRIPITCTSQFRYSNKYQSGTVNASCCCFFPTHIFTISSLQTFLLFHTEYFFKNLIRYIWHSPMVYAVDYHIKRFCTQYELQFLKPRDPPTFVYINYVHNENQANFH